MSARPWPKDARARIAIATNNGDIGGGEVMLLHIATALRELGVEPIVVGPSEPGDIVRAAEAQGFETVELRAVGRRAYMAALAAWRLRHPRLPLWCNGLVPTLATAGMGPRIAHLHIIPTGVHRVARALGRVSATVTLVPSDFMGRELDGVQVLENWTEDLPLLESRCRSGDAVRIGFLGRLTRDKGVDVLARAMQEVIAGSEHDVTLVLAGEPRFASAGVEEAITRALAPIEDHVERIGWVDREKFFADIDLAVFPSTWPEPFGLVAAEAMAQGVPFVVSDAGALPEVVGPQHPWIARAGDPSSLARTILDALDADEPRRGSVVRGARERWESEFSPRAGTERVAALLQDLAGRR